MTMFDELWTAGKCACNGVWPRMPNSSTGSSSATRMVL
eukprot:CAMPEP_0202862858 /NCGR_PEP_ID=MMETSP1391-20130828/3739_1 /ASSEMBLY_ACC=CAM_ASM_000867 /TAXON_ID=1034604 /ORGANISM="Chlamydomonas leiostraca, Strain SAG 11-49" /LENGTH=37 /DNA_ID= /DNA_START= /DNA_END= /DNA_ORIENTATION=